MKSIDIFDPFLGLTDSLGLPMFFMAVRARTKQIINGSKIGRNQKCDCGSGEKYKKCCGKDK